MLYLAVLLHDIAKGRGGDHSELGADIADRLGPRLGLTAEETETVAWLVRYHLIMSNTAFRRDIEDPKTIADFTEAVQSMERLRLLLGADRRRYPRGRAEGLERMEGAAAPRALSARREIAFRRSHHRRPRGPRRRDPEAACAPSSPIGAMPISRPMLRAAPLPCWLSFPLPSLVRQARLIREAELDKRPLSIDYAVDNWRAMTEVTIYVADWRGLVSQLAGRAGACPAPALPMRGSSP